MDTGHGDPPSTEPTAVDERGEDPIQVAPLPDDNMSTNSGANDTPSNSEPEPEPKPKKTAKVTPFAKAGVNSFKNAANRILKAIRWRRSTYAAVYEDGSLATKIKIAYGAPNFSMTSLTMLIGIYGVLFFNGLGANLGFIAFFTALARSFDVVSDPLMGWISDQTRTKYGRRRPFMIVACWGYALSFVLLFSPPSSLEGTGVAIWFGIFYILFYLFDTVANVPWGALGPELTDVPEERDRVFFTSQLFRGFGTMVGAAGPALMVWLVKKTDKDCSCQYELEGFCSNGDGKDFGSFPLETYVEATCANPTSAFTGTELDEIEAWCKCVEEDCPNVCYQRMAFMIVALFFAATYLIAMVICVYMVKEREIVEGQRQPPLVPSVRKTMRNKPFMTLLPAWALDYIVVSMIGGMMPFFVTYVIRPEDFEDCDLPENEGTLRCSSTPWIGVALFLLMVAWILSMPVWLWLTRKFGKRRIWLAFNLANAVTNFLFVIVGNGETMMYLALFFTFLNGIPAGGQFLTESILADVIDYDEFLTGKRSEGGFTIFQTFLPKVVSIPAQAVPLALLSALGFVEPINGVPQDQEASVEIFIRVVFAVIPSILALLSFFLKTRFPIKTEEQLRKIVEGASLHLQGFPAVDPLTGRVKELLALDPVEEERSWELSNFSSKQVKLMVENCYSAVTKQLTRVSVICATLSVVFLGTVIGTFQFLEEPALAWLPSFAVICFGLSVTATAFNGLRLKAARRLEANPEETEFLEKIHTYMVGEELDHDDLDRANEIIVEQQLVNETEEGSVTEEAAVSRQQLRKRLTWASSRNLDLVNE